MSEVHPVGYLRVEDISLLLWNERDKINASITGFLKIILKWNEHVKLKDIFSKNIGSQDPV